MKRFIILCLHLPLIFFSSCTPGTPGHHDFYSGTTPVLELESGTIDPFVIFLDVNGESVLYENNAVPYKIIYETEDLVQIETNLSLHPELHVKKMSYSIQDQMLILELEGLNRNIKLEKHDRMIERKVNEFVTVELSTDVTHLSDNQKLMLKKLFRVADIMDTLFWMEACPEYQRYLDKLEDPYQREFFMLNYGPWERLNGDLPFLPGVEAKPEGSGFYPADMTREEFEALDDDGKDDLYTFIRRKPDGSLEVIPYHVMFSEHVEKASQLLSEAADLAEDDGFKNYLNLRAQALMTDDYLASDMAWMDMKDNPIDFITGPIENYEDRLFNYKAAHEAFILIKDSAWTEKIAYINSFLPELQQSLPVPNRYKQEVPGSSSDLGVYDAVYYAGDCNASSKTIAINLPNDERVQLAKGSRKLQLKNAIRYKFEKILIPISNVLIAGDQRSYISFDAFFENTMFHEIAHGLGLNNTVNGKGTVRSVLKDQYSALEEGKADILGLFLVTQLAEMGVLKEQELMDNYVTFMASIFRSVRFGATSSHGKANMIRFYYFQEKGAFIRDTESGTYRIDPSKMKDAMHDLASEILTIQGDGNYQAASKLVREKGFIREDLQKDLDRLEALGIPVDIKFRQGPEILGL